MQFSASQIAAMTGGTVEGDGDVLISSFAKIEEGHPGAISFLANPKYAHYIYGTKSSAVLVSKTFVPEHALPCTIIRVDDPYATVASLLAMVESMMKPVRCGIEQPCFIAEGVEIPSDAYVGAFAYIAKGAKIFPGAQIYPQAYVGENVEIGENAVVYAGAKIYHHCVIGRRCVIHAGAVIGANTTVDRATMGSTRICKGSKLDNLIQIAHNCVVGENTVMAAQSGIAGSTKIGSQCMIGGQVGFAGHIEVGDNVQIGAQSGIPSSVKAGSRLMGTPAVDAAKFARQFVLLKNLPTLASRLKSLEDKIK